MNHSLMYYITNIMKLLNQPTDLRSNCFCRNRPVRNGKYNQTSKTNQALKFPFPFRAVCNFVRIVGYDILAWLGELIAPSIAVAQNIHHSTATQFVADFSAVVRRSPAASFLMASSLTASVFVGRLRHPL